MNLGHLLIRTSPAYFNRPRGNNQLKIRSSVWYLLFRSGAGTIRRGPRRGLFTFRPANPLVYHLDKMLRLDLSSAWQRALSPNLDILFCNRSSLKNMVTRFSTPERAHSYSSLTPHGQSAIV